MVIIYSKDMGKTTPPPPFSNFPTPGSAFDDVKLTFTPVVHCLVANIPAPMVTKFTDSNIYYHISMHPGAIPQCHYGDAIMSAMASQITSLNRLFRCRSKKTSKIRVTGLCEGNSPVTGEFCSQRTRPVTLKMFPFDDVITVMVRIFELEMCHLCPPPPLTKMV